MSDLLERISVAWGVLRGHGVVYGVALYVVEELEEGNRSGTPAIGIIGIRPGRDAESLLVKNVTFSGDWRIFREFGVLIPVQELSDE